MKAQTVTRRILMKFLKIATGGDERNDQASMMKRF